MPHVEILSYLKKSSNSSRANEKKHVTRKFHLSQPNQPQDPYHNKREPCEIKRSELSDLKLKAQMVKGNDCLVSLQSPNFSSQNDCRFCQNYWCCLQENKPNIIEAHNGQLPNQVGFHYLHLNILWSGFRFGTQQCIMVSSPMHDLLKKKNMQRKIKRKKIKML